VQASAARRGVGLQAGEAITDSAVQGDRYANSGSGRHRLVYRFAVKREGQRYQTKAKAALKQPGGGKGGGNRTDSTPATDGALQMWTTSVRYSAKWRAESESQRVAGR
jgi:hypothetical protein